MAEVFFTFLRLGCYSFGGPVAHLGYFRKELVERRQWCSDETFAEVIALAQSLPGPASSQTGFALGILRAGIAGGVAAFLGFTLPSALLMLLFAFGHRFLTGSTGIAIVHGLQLAAVAVVSQAIIAMRRTLAPDWRRMVIAAAGLVIALGLVSFWGTLITIAVGAVAGLVLLKQLSIRLLPSLQSVVPKYASLGAAAAFLACFLVPGSSLFGAFYRTGALVFGGGHVVLPLLEETVVARGWVDQQSFLSGYGAAQALPGPLFTFAMYLGAVANTSLQPAVAGVLALVGLFLPGLLLIVAVFPLWTQLRRNRHFQPALAGVNAAVLGILGAALVRPIFVSSVHSATDVLLVAVAVLALTAWKRPSWQVVAGMVVVSLARTSFD